jgi:ABC-type multidrug transport system ATPase subunit
MRAYAHRFARIVEGYSNLNMTSHAQIQGISGGEKKRLAFASEVLTNPALLFCDEPTTGLDSFMAEGVVHVLRRIAASGKTVICTIHQPASEVFALFDNLLLMADGHVAYYGLRTGAISFFAQVGCKHLARRAFGGVQTGLPCPDDYNPADFFIEQLAVTNTKLEESRTRVDMICSAFEQSQTKADLDGRIAGTLLNRFGLCA